MNGRADALATLDAAVRHALATGDESGLDVLGHGEISLVVAVDTPEGRVAAKRLPRFPDEAALGRYRSVFGEYLARLDELGVATVPSELVRIPDLDEVIAYCVQPALDPACLATNIVRTGNAAVLDRIVGTTAAAVSERVGLDAQLSNWALVDDRLVHLDVTTPMLTDEAGAQRADLDLFLASLPWALRPPVRAFLLAGILATYHDPRLAVLDLVANLLKEGLEDLLPVAVDAANARVDPPLTPGEVRSYYARDARMWALLQRLRRVDRAWQRHVRRRPYPFLVPPDTER